MEESRVRRWLVAARFDEVTAGLVAAFAALRLAAVLGRPISVYPDTPSYFDFGLWGAVRFPVVTAFYALIGDHRAVVTLQAVVAVGVWSAAAVLAASVLVPRGVRYGVVAAVLLIGLTEPVTKFDNALLSESLSISLTVLFTAVVLRFGVRPTARMGVGVLVVGALWGLSRQSNAILLLVVVALVFALGAGRARRAVAWRVAGGLLAVAVLGIAMASSTTQIQEYNTAQIFVRRILPDDARTDWFRDRGMPASGRKVLADPLGTTGVADPAVALQTDDAFGAWLEGDGPRVYLRYLASHPGLVVTTPFSDDGARNAFAVGTTAYGGARRVVPDLVETAVWPQTASDQLPVGVFALAIVVAAVATSLRPPRRGALAAPLGVLVVAAANVVLVTHSAGWEYERLLLPTSIAARIALIWLFGLVLGDVATEIGDDADGQRRDRQRVARSRASSSR